MVKIMDYQKISDLIKKYEEIKNLGSSDEKLYCQATLRDIVLTGAEIVEKGILEKILLAMKIEANEWLQKKHDELGEEYIELKEKHEKLEEEKKELSDSLDSNSIYEEQIKEMKRFIKRKSGNIIDEIRDVLYNDED